MKAPMFKAMYEAMALVRQSRVAAATRLIQKSLRTGYAKTENKKTSPLSRRRLGETIQSLRDEKAAAEKRAEFFEVLEAPSRNQENPHFTTREFSASAGSLSYMLYVPSDWNPKNSALIMMLHGCTQTPADFAAGTQMNALADEYNFIVAYPQQPRTSNPSACWNWFDTRHQSRGSGEPAKLAGLAQSLAEEFNIAKDKVFVAGLSAGGAMAEVLGIAYPDVFAAVGIHSGLPFGVANNAVTAFAAMKGTAKTAKLPTSSTKRTARKIIFHGSADKTVHPSNAERLFENARRDCAEFSEMSSTTTINGRQVTRTILEDAKGRALVEKWTVEGAGHAWIGGDRKGSYTDNAGPGASRSIIHFFLQQ